MEEKDFVLPDYPIVKNTGEVCWKAPSNIALIKYWGKKGIQIPANPSLSFTLDTSATTTKLAYEPVTKQADSVSYELFFEGQINTDFRPKIDTFFSRISPFLPFLNKFHYRIDTSNSFPHSSGIASSASGFAALAACLMDIEKSMNPEMGVDFFMNKTSFLARLGSGSACRSVQGPLMLWGNHDNLDQSNDRYAIVYPEEVDKIFHSYRDIILLVDKGENMVSSSAGHGLMKGHLFAQSRFEQAHQNLNNLKNSLRSADLDKFIEIVESEALSLHAMMMTSIPYYLLMKPNTVAIIERIWDFRSQTGLPVCFTLDAGANVHLLFPDEHQVAINQFIEEELSVFCMNGSTLKDNVGRGCQKI